MKERWEKKKNEAQEAHAPCSWVLLALNSSSFLRKLLLLHPCISVCFLLFFETVLNKAIYFLLDPHKDHWARNFLSGLACRLLNNFTSSSFLISIYLTLLHSENSISWEGSFMEKHSSGDEVTEMCLLALSFFSFLAFTREFLQIRHGFWYPFPG